MTRKVTREEYYGRYYWCVKVVKHLSKDGDIYLNADEVEITNNGDLVFYSVNEERKLQNLSISKGNWIAFYAASCLDGSAVSVSHWKCEYTED